MIVVDKAVCGEVDHAILSEFITRGEFSVCGEVNGLELRITGKLSNCVGFLTTETQPAESIGAWISRPQRVSLSAFLDGKRATQPGRGNSWIIVRENRIGEHGNRLICRFPIRRFFSEQPDHRS